MNSKIIPWLFVLIWSTGFVAAKYGLQFAEPFTLLSYRNGLTLIVLIIFTQVNKSI
jgi:drug/metabolite transporter (DMT)-like permease